jgi:hypothetical protein
MRKHRKIQSSQHRPCLLFVLLAQRSPGDGSDHVEDLEQHGFGDARVQLADVKTGTGRGPGSSGSSGSARSRSSGTSIGAGFLSGSGLGLFLSLSGSRGGLGHGGLGLVLGGHYGRRSRYLEV